MKVLTNTDSPSAWAALEELALSRAKDGERGGRPHLALDIGANVGQAAELLAPYFQRVLAYEPQPESYRHLCERPEANIEPMNWAVSRRPGTIMLAEASEAIESGQLVTWGASAGHPEWGHLVGTVKVAATTVDVQVGSLGVLPSLVKIDTEGHELEVLAGAKSVIALGFSSWFIEVHDASYGPRLRAYFGPRRYKTHVIEHDYLADERSEDHYYFVAEPK